MIPCQRPMSPHCKYIAHVDLTLPAGVYVTVCMCVCLRACACALTCALAGEEGYFFLVSLRRSVTASVDGVARQVQFALLLIWSYQYAKICQKYTRHCVFQAGSCLSTLCYTVPKCVPPGPGAAHARLCSCARTRLYASQAELCS